MSRWQSGRPLGKVGREKRVLLRVECPRVVSLAHSGSGCRRGPHGGCEPLAGAPRSRQAASR